MRSAPMLCGLLGMALASACAAAPGDPPHRRSFEGMEVVEADYLGKQQGVILARRSGECYVQFFSESGVQGAWVPESNIRYPHRASPDYAVSLPGPPDLAPLYQAIGQAMGGVVCVALLVVVLALALRRKHLPPPGQV